MPRPPHEPRITIGVTSYDRFDLLIETINSIKSQVFSDFKVIIVNDNPKRILKVEALGIENDKRFVIINHLANLGEIQTLNSVLALARSEYFTWLSDDDLIHPHFLRDAVSELDAHEKTVAFYSAYSTGTHWDNHSNFLTSDMEPCVFEFSKLLPAYASREIRLIGCYGIFRRKALQASGGFNQLGSGFSPYSDTILPILISQFGPVIYVDKPYVFLRTHMSSLSSSSQDLKSYVSAQKDFLIFLQLLLNEEMVLQRESVLCDFYKWFSDDRAGVIRRSNRLVAPILKQIVEDYSFLLDLKVKNSLRLKLIPSILIRTQLTIRTLLKAKLIRLSTSKEV